VWTSLVHVCNALELRLRIVCGGKARVSAVSHVQCLCFGNHVIIVYFPLQHFENDIWLPMVTLAYQIPPEQ